MRSRIHEDDPGQGREASFTPGFELACGPFSASFFSVPPTHVPPMHGFVDLHCHWVAAIDDGVRAPAEAWRSCGASRGSASDASWRRRTCAPGCSTTTRRCSTGRSTRCKRPLAQARAEGSLPEVHLASEHFFDDVVFGRLRRGEGAPLPFVRAGGPALRGHARRSAASSSSSPPTASRPRAQSLLRPPPRRASPRSWPTPSATSRSGRTRRASTRSRRRSAPPARRLLARRQVRARRAARGGEASRGRRLRGSVLGRAQAGGRRHRRGGHRAARGARGRRGGPRAALGRPAPNLAHAHGGVRRVQTAKSKTGTSGSWRRRSQSSVSVTSGSRSRSRSRASSRGRSGFDIHKEKVDELRRGYDRNHESPAEVL